VQVLQQQADIHQVERSAGKLVGGLDVGVDELEAAGDRGPQDRQRLATQPAVVVHPGHLTGRTDPLGQQPHDLAWSAAHVQAAHAGADADLVEHSGGDRLPQTSLPAQALVFLGGSTQDVVVVGRVGGRGRRGHRCLLGARDDCGVQSQKSGT
jgi:hypothetical protein